MSGFGNKMDARKPRAPQMHYLQVYDPRQAMRNRRFKYRPLTLKPVSASLRIVASVGVASLEL